MTVIMAEIVEAMLSLMSMSKDIRYTRHAFAFRGSMSTCAVNGSPVRG